MSANQKLSDEIWADARDAWESDLRKGYAWLVTDLALPITGAAVRKRAMKEGWAKKALPEVSRSRTGEPRCCCGDHGNHGQVEKTSVRRGRITQSEILDRLAQALEAVADCTRALRETLPRKTKG